jgi:hydroxyethylthiazole kinase
MPAEGDEMHAPIELPDIAADILARVRERAPRVHCITNTVAQAYTANMLLAAGAVPSMTLGRDEIGIFVTGADALLVNLGTFDAERRAAVAIAVGEISEHQKPWVLDPVFIERSPGRAEFARELILRGPSVVRLNRAEFKALAGADGDDDAAMRFARSHSTVIGLTGEADLVTDGMRRAVIANGHALMSRVTAMGCAGSALVGAFCAVEADAWLATAAALIAFGVAGEVAAEHARGPGSFASAIIDTLYNLDRATLRARAKVSS